MSVPKEPTNTDKIDKKSLTSNINGQDLASNEDISRIKSEVDEHLRSLEQSKPNLFDKERVPAGVTSRPSNMPNNNHSTSGSTEKPRVPIIASSAIGLAIGTVLTLGALNSYIASNPSQQISEPITQEKAPAPPVDITRQEQRSSAFVSPPSRSDDSGAKSTGPEPVRNRSNNNSEQHDGNSNMQSNIAGSACYFRSYKLSPENFNCSYSSRVNANGHTVYDVQWSDNMRSRYVFWRNYKVEIYDSNKRDTRSELARFAVESNGVRIFTDKGSETFLSGLAPTIN